jgi:hypothetical protein
MPNPDRPQYQDTIEETWGQAVADTVVRRYTSSADRDADLGAFTPAELGGQLIVIATPGSLPFLQQHDGAGAWVTIHAPAVLDAPFIGAAPPADVPLRTVQGSFVGATTGSGDLMIPLAKWAFAYGYNVVVTPCDAVGGSIWTALPLVASSALGHLVVACFYLPTALAAQEPAEAPLPLGPIAGTLVRVNYQITGA